MLKDKENFLFISGKYNIIYLLLIISVIYLSFSLKNAAAQEPETITLDQGQNLRYHFYDGSGPNNHHPGFFTTGRLNPPPLTNAPGSSFQEFRPSESSEKGIFSWQNVGPPGTYFASFQLCLTDASGNPISCGIVAVNIIVRSAPVANAGPDQTVRDGQIVTLGASNREPGVIYSWTQIGGSHVVLAGANTPHPTFTAPRIPQNEILSFQLIVNHNPVQEPDGVEITGGTGGFSHHSIVHVKVISTLPVANAGHDQNVRERQIVTLDGTGSFDPERQPISYRWTQISGPAPWMHSFSNTNTAHPTFTAPAAPTDSVLTFELIISVGSVNSLPSHVNIHVSANHQPIANAGGSQTVDEGTNVRLSGSASSDPDGDTITYRWEQTSGQPVIQLIGQNTVSPSFVAPKVNEDMTFTFKLTVNDGAVDSQPSLVTVVIKPKLTLSVVSDTPDINPYPQGIDSYIGNNPPQPQAEISVVARHVFDSSPAIGFRIKVEACTELGRSPTPGTVDADGHTNDIRGDPCEKTDRPSSIIRQSQNNVNNPIVATTDQTGKITLNYLSPRVTDANGTTYIISGKDNIHALWKDNNDNPSLEEATATAATSIITRVPDLQRMPGSENCPPGHIGESFSGSESYFFVKGPINGCEFYGTTETNGALVDLANVYLEKQKECMNNPNGECEIRIGPKLSDPVITIVIDKVIPLGIRSMSLPWGGLFDINGDWQPPYIFNNNGKEVNLSWKDKNGTLIDDDHKALLWSLIKADDRWIMPIDKQGGDFVRSYDILSGSSEIDNNRFYLEYIGGG